MLLLLLTVRSAQTAFCGNGIVDGDEECDAGTNSKIGLDKCCTPECKLKPTATCRYLFK